MAEAPHSSITDGDELRRAFREYDRGVYCGNARRTAFISAAFMLLGTALDWVVVPAQGLDFLIIRCICAALLGLVYWFMGKSRGAGYAVLVSHAIGLLPLVSICIMIAVTEGGNSVYYAGLNLILVGLSLLFRWSFWNMLGMVCLTFLLYTVSVVVSAVTPDAKILFGNYFFLFVTSILVVAGSHYYEKLRFIEFCLRAEVEKSRALLEAQNQQLKELDQAKTRFFANISHELRTPLTITLGITERLGEVLGRQAADPQIQEMTHMLEQNGLRLLKLIDDLLDLVRFDTGSTQIVRQATVISDHLDGLLRSVRHLAEQDLVTLRWECVADCDAVMLDRDKFDRILLNLIINAIKFTPAGGFIDVRVSVRENRLALTVEDTGEGIAPDVLPRIFDRFWQADTSSTRKFQGVGIGLALVRSLCDAMDGEVKVDSKLGDGTVFTVLLPVETGDDTFFTRDGPLMDGGNIANLHRRAAMSIPGKLAAHPAASSPDTVSNRTARPLVLIADDEPDIRRFLRMQLEEVDVIEASDGLEALELVRLRGPQLVLLDHMMPGMNGVEVCRNIRESPETCGVAVIVLTARADEATKMAALKAGANDFLTKPFSTAELGLRLENQIGMARIRREMADLNSELHAALEQITENEVLMLRNEKLSALGRMSAGIIHEINNPLNYVGAGIHSLGGFAKLVPDKDRADYEDILNDIREGVERVSQIVIDLRKFAREDKSVTGDADLVEIVGGARRMVMHQVGKEIAFHLKSPDHAVISGNPSQLIQVFVNFFQNSIDAIQMRVAAHGGDAGRIDVSIDAVGEGWQVGILDNGIGISEEDLQRIFDPFFTSKDVGKGMGLGLSITHQILKTHQAIIQVDSQPMEFTRFRIAFPAAGDMACEDSGLDQTLSIHHSPANDFSIPRPS